jgi:NH3-dependent NAD+ synthetase
MFTRSASLVVDVLVQKARELGNGCEKVFVAVSGGVDSTVMLMILIQAFGADSVVGLFRDIKSKREHQDDVMALQRRFSFHLINIDANKLYDDFLAQCKMEFEASGLPWYEEGSEESARYHWDNAYGSLKSRFTTPMAGFVSKAIDSGRGRIFGTGNAEEDELLRYFDKYGDGAVDNNILKGLTKCEVRQLSLYFANHFECDVLQKIAEKIPSADLQGNGDAHNDESELSSWARAMGYDLLLSYGSPEKEGNIAWVLKQNFDYGVITGEQESSSLDQLQKLFGYNEEQVQLIDVIRRLEKSSRHKVLPQPGVSRHQLRALGLVD